MNRAAWKVLLPLLLLAANAAAQEVPWTRSCRFAVEVDGRPSREAMVFERRGVADLLGRLGDGTWFLVQPVQQQVHPMPAGAVSLDAEGRQATVQALPGATQGTRLTLTPSGLTFDVGQRWVRVIVTPPLLGPVSFDDFLSLCPEFQERERAYQPQPEKVRAIAGAAEEMTLEIYFGSWCPHCQEVLPKLIRSLKDAANPRLRVKMIGLPRAFGDDPSVKTRQVKGVPTMILFRKDVEVGRFSGTEPTPVEETLARLVGS